MKKPDNIPVSVWAYYFTVDGIDAGAERIKEAGGQVLMGPQEVPGGQWIVQGMDPQGANFALVSQRRNKERHACHKITPCLWYDGKAEEAANFYVTLFPDSRVDNVVHSPADTPSGPEGYVLVVEFTLAGQPYIGLNGGPQFHFTEAVSFQVRPRTRQRPTGCGTR